MLIVFSGRPLVLTSAAQHVTAILEAWFPGTEAGPAIADVLFGDTNPSGKLPVSFPRAEGQEPLYLSQLPTGRPADGARLSYPPKDASERFYSRYIDVPNSPLFPFGYGLSYSRFDYSGLRLNCDFLHVGQLDNSAAALTAEVSIRNSGSVKGTEIVQLYLRVRGTSVAQPVRSLKGFERVTLLPGETKTVKFPLGFKQLSFVNARGKWVVEPAEHTIFVGGSSGAAQSVDFHTIP